MDTGKLLVALAALLAALLIFRLVKGSGKSKQKGKLGGPDRDVHRLLESGRYDEAANLALQRGQHEQAIDYYLRAQKPARAAQVAAQKGDARRAAELYERSGQNEQAAKYYDQAGLREKAKTLRSGKNEPAPAAEANARVANALAKADNVDRDALKKAEAFIAAGDLNNAARAYRDGRHFEQAIHLYVNVLGLPGEAAPILVECGRPERGAELYELAGQNERAAETWIGVARSGDRPAAYAEKIRQLSPARAVPFLQEQVSKGAVSRDNAETHYQLGLSLASCGDSGRALEIFINLQNVVGEYRDVGRHIAQWNQSPARSEVPLVYGDAAGPDLPELSRDLLEAELAALSLEESRHARDDLVLTEADIIVDATYVRAPTPGPPARSFAGLGLEREALPTLLIDSAVHAARVGPSIESLAKFIRGQACDLGNIEAYYRLGLAYLARGEWPMAMQAFRAVDEASPGYRDAQERASVISAWQAKMASHLTATGIRGAHAPSAQSSRYTILGELGRGGMAVVYRATDEALGREVALKFLSDEYLAQQTARDMFWREARSVAQLNHPNVVTIYDIGHLEGRTFIAMEYVEGVTLKDLLERRRPAVIDCVKLIVQLLDALEYAHGRSIIHRDIKPSNVMRTTTGLLKLMDFGLAKSIAGGNKQSMVAGTPAYMSPEQMLGEDLDARTDLFSVGVTLYELLSGVLPFKQMDRSPPKSTREYNAAVPRILDDLVLRSIALDTEGRFQTAGSFKSPLKRILTQYGSRTSGDIQSADLPHIEMMPARAMSPSPPSTVRVEDVYTGSDPKLANKR